jgi:predicted ribosome quality control (RQC) complex YloA/Tae2 family protein
MPFDGFSTSALVWELKEMLLRSRVDHISQPYPLELIITLRQPGKNFPLLLSADPMFPRAHIAQSLPASPSTPPGFCMLLRKYLSGARLIEISQPGWERIIYFKFQQSNSNPLLLAIELMGRHSNIILFDPETNIILDSIKHVTHQVNRFRELIPSSRYCPPPKGGKLEPDQLTFETLKNMLSASKRKCKELLQDSLLGLSPFLIKELLVRACYQTSVACSDVDPQTLWNTWQELLKLRESSQFQPCLISKGRDFAALMPVGCSGTPAPSLNAAIAQAIGEAARDRQLAQLKGRLGRAVRQAKKRSQRKISAQKAELARAENAEKYRIMGEMLKAGLSQVTPGSQEVSLPNYYDPQLRPITIPLDASLSPGANLEKLFHRYGRLKKGQQKIARQLASSQEELAYLESVEQSLQDANFEDLSEIEAELRATGYLASRRKQEKPRASQPHRFKYREHEILVGRNNYQNDRLTIKQAGRNDLWLHTKQIPGSHVIVRPGTEDEEIILMAAQIAAYYSKAREGQNVPVDYTLVKHVHKPNGAKPGFVIYKNERTVFVDPKSHSDLEVHKL